MSSSQCVQSQSLVDVDGGTAKDEHQAEATKKNPAMQFLLEQVVVWLSEEGRLDTEHLVEMLFSSLCCCSGQETTRILNHVTTVLRRSWNSRAGTRQRLFTHVSTFLSDGAPLENRLANYQTGRCHCAGLHQRA